MNTCDTFILTRGGAGGANVTIHVLSGLLLLMEDVLGTPSSIVI